MTTARAQPLNIFAASKARDFLREANILVTEAKSLFFDTDDFATAARLKNIQDRLADEIQVLERLMAASKRAFRY